MKPYVRDVRTLFATLLALAVICGGVAAPELYARYGVRPFGAGVGRSGHGGGSASLGRYRAVHRENRARHEVNRARADLNDLRREASRRNMDSHMRVFNDPDMDGLDRLNEMRRRMEMQDAVNRAEREVNRLINAYNRRAAERSQRRRDRELGIEPLPGTPRRGGSLRDDLRRADRALREARDELDSPL